MLFVFVRSKNVESYKSFIRHLEHFAYYASLHHFYFSLFFIISFIIYYYVYYFVALFFRNFRMQMVCGFAHPF